MASLFTTFIFLNDRSVTCLNDCILQLRGCPNRSEHANDRLPILKIHSANSTAQHFFDKKRAFLKFHLYVFVKQQMFSSICKCRKWMGVLPSPYRGRGEPSAMTLFMSGICDAFFTLAGSLSKTCMYTLYLATPELLFFLQEITF